jgi:hypothetical protein
MWLSPTNALEEEIAVELTLLAAVVSGINVGDT